MICKDCYHKPGCEKTPDENGRCSFFVKSSKVEIGENVDVNPMDTETFDYHNIKGMFEDSDLSEEPLKELGPRDRSNIQNK